MAIAQSNDVTKLFRRPTLVAVVTKTWDSISNN